MKKLISTFCLGIILLVSANSISAEPVYRFATGADGAAIQGAVNQFRLDLGGLNNGNSGPRTSGRREINWDFFTNADSAPSVLPNTVLNNVHGRGLIINNITFEAFSTAHPQNYFMVSASAASGTPVRFGNINSSYPAIFKTFSGERLFTMWNTHIIEINFFIPYTQTPATVSGFGAVFTDVDALSTPGTTIWCYDSYGNSIVNANVNAANNGLSFLGVSFNEGERIARVVIKLGNAALSASNNDGAGGVDVVAMDDIIYGEPRAREFHSGDVDGDGVTDARIFRPSNGQWFTFNSGTSTVTIEQWGLNGDVPVDGDFDGDARADLAVFRPSNGQWWIKRSSDGSAYGATFGQPGDKPVAGDYDKDGKTDIAIWRPSNGNYFVLRSTNNSFYSFPFGAAGDIPVQGGAQ